MTSLPLAHVFQCLFCVRFCFALIVRNLTAQLTGSHGGIGGGIQIPETSHSFKLSFLLPPRCQRAPESSQAKSGFSVEAGNRRIPPPVKTKVAGCSGYEICLCAPFFLK